MACFLMAFLLLGCQCLLPFSAAACSRASFLSADSVFNGFFLFISQLFILQPVLQWLHLQLPGHCPALPDCASLSFCSSASLLSVRAEDSSLMPCAYLHKLPEGQQGSFLSSAALSFLQLPHLQLLHPSTSFSVHKVATSRAALSSLPSAYRNRVVSTS